MIDLIDLIDLIDFTHHHCGTFVRSVRSAGDGRTRYRGTGASAGAGDAGTRRGHGATAMDDGGSGAEETDWKPRTRTGADVPAGAFVRRIAVGVREFLSDVRGGVSGGDG